MKILLASSTLDRKNGYGNITYELSRTLVKKGIDLTLLLPKNCVGEIPDNMGVDVRTVLPPYLFRYSRPGFLKYLTWSFPKTERYDLWHSLFAFPYAPIIAYHARRRRAPFIVGAQGTYGVKPLKDIPERYLLKYAYRVADKIHVPSMYTRDAIIKNANEHYGIDVIHNGVDFERFAAMRGKEDNPVKRRFEGKKILLTVGQLKSRKGQDLVIRALPEILKAHDDVVYLVVGGDGWNGYLERLAGELGVSEHVVFPGRVSDEDIADYFNACDIYVHTPRIAAKYYFEGFGIVYLEAGAAGKPAVGADAGGIRDALIHGETGFVAGDENVEEIAFYTTKLLDDPVLRKRFGQNAVEYAWKHTWDHVADQYMQMYEEAIKAASQQ